MEKAFITGISGFAGSHLAELLLQKKFEVHGLLRWRAKTENIDHLKHKLVLHEGDLLDAHSLDSVMVEIKPDYIFHLAAQSFVPASWKSPTATLQVNVIGSANLFEAVKKSGLDPTIQIAGSSEEYGLVYPNETPITEENPLRPLSPYGVSKVATDFLGFQYYKSYGMKIVRTRGFNHTGPRRGEVFVTSNFAKQIAEIEKGERKVLKVGNLSVKRDFSDVRDVARAYFLAVEKCIPGEVYNVCSEKCYTIREMLDMLIDLSKAKIRVEEDPARMRPADVELLLGNCQKFRKQTGWKNEFPFKKTLEDLLNYWREKV